MNFLPHFINILKMKEINVEIKSSDQLEIQTADHKKLAEYAHIAVKKIYQPDLNTSRS
jgi:pimeloyl-CoA synthetase